MVDVAKPNKVGRPKAFAKETVLLKAIDVFSDRGYEATSIQDLVVAMGINRFSLYDEFGGKHGLFLEALEMYQTRRRSRIMTLFALPGPKRELLREYFVITHRESVKGKTCGCMMVNSAVELARDDQEIATRISRHVSKLEDIFLGLLTEAKARCEIRTDKDLRAVARYLLNVSRGLRVLMTFDQDPKVFDDILNIALGALDG